MNTTRVRFDCRFGNGETTALYADLTDAELATVLTQLHRYQIGEIPPYALVAVVARTEPDRDDLNGYREFRVWRVTQVLSVPDEVVLYERRRVEPVADDDQPDAVNLPLSRELLERVLAGQVIRVNIPVDPDNPHYTGLTVFVRLKR